MVTSGDLGDSDGSAPSEPAVAALIRTWRTEVAGMSAAAAAAALGVTRSAVANWESGVRHPGPERMLDLDRVLGAGGVLAEMVGGAGTPAAFEPDREWWHHYRDGGGPVWAWIRALGAPGEVRIRVRWGYLGIDVTRPVGTAGLLLTLPVSTSSPPAHVVLDPPGWVEFGHGRPPAELGIPTLSAIRHVHPVAPDDPAAGLIGGRLAPLLARDQRIAHLVERLGFRPAPGPRPARVADLTDQPLGPPPWDRHWPGTRYRALRQLRGLSQRAAAEQVTRLRPDEPVSDDQILLVERGGEPRAEELFTRLDIVYRGNGRTVVANVPARREGEGFRVQLPPWWRGPVWVQLGTPGDVLPETPGLATLRWEPWEKQVRAWPGTTVGFHATDGDPPGPLVTLPAGWRLRAGVGHPPGAANVDHDWYPVDDHHGGRILQRYGRAYLELARSAARDLAEELRRSGDA